MIIKNLRTGKTTKEAIYIHLPWDAQRKASSMISKGIIRNKQPYLLNRSSILLEREESPLLIFITPFTGKFH